LVSPQVLYYNIIYHLRNIISEKGLNPLDEEIEKRIEDVVMINVRKVEE
jgi:hypothetical protein